MVRFIYYIIPISFFLIIWVPVFDYYRVPDIVLTNEILNKARSLPADSTLDELNGKAFGFGLSRSWEWESDEQLILTAEKFLNGQIEIPGFISTKIDMPFNADDIDKDIPFVQLCLAALIVPDVLLDAYQITGRNYFLVTAREVILQWALFERSAWLPKGLLWNDHAISARIIVLAKFWRLYRNHQDYKPDVAQAVLQFAARSGQLLAKRSHFTVATNHGIMQNLALWHLCLAFPSITDVNQYKQLALTRMREQMHFYLNKEGVFLEHSAGYQRVGLELIGMTFRYLTLLDMPIDGSWKENYQKAKKFYSQLRRPDGSLPMFGDTRSNNDLSGPLVLNVDDIGQIGKPDHKKWQPQQAYSIYPLAKYAIWWDGLDKWPDEQGLSQTVILWSFFPGHAHKHADEMSVLLWANGKTWWTNTGYWPYGSHWRKDAISWSGSNAPHLVNESTKSIRDSRLLFYGQSNDISIIDLERKGPQEYVAQRQIIYLKPNLWIVVDYTTGDNKGRTTTTWTTSHKVSLNRGEITGSYVLKGEDNSSSLTNFIITSENATIRQFRGSYDPFAGWEVIDDNFRHASAIVIEQPANKSWAVAIWSLENAVDPNLQFTEQPYMQNWESPMKWKIVLPVKPSPLNIWREDDVIYVNEGNGSDSSKEVKLIKAPELKDEYEDIIFSYEKSASQYPKYNTFLDHRWMITYFLIFVIILQEVFFLIYRKIKGKHYEMLRILSMFVWVSMISVWLVKILKYGHL